MALFAGDIKLAQPLKDPLSQIGVQSQGNLADALGKIRSRATTSSRASGRPQGVYQGQAIDRAGASAGRGINDALYGALGTTSYNDFRNQQQFERQMALAKEIGDKMSPSTAEEVLGGLSQGVKLGAKGAGIYQALGNGSTPRTSSALDLYNPGSTGASRYGLGSNPFAVPPSYDYSQWGG